MKQIPEDPNASKRRPRPAEDLCPHSIDAMRFKTFIFCYKDRIRKEQAINMGEERLAQAYAPGVTKDYFPVREFYPVGCYSKFNNDSNEFKKTFAPNTWSTSGAITTHHRDTFGRPSGSEGNAQMPTINLSQSLPSLSQGSGGSRGRKVWNGRGNAKLSMLTSEHERQVKAEAASRNGDLSRAMRHRLRELKRDPNPPPEGKWW
eukprot:TRINITY_DN63010_c0_g1_i1.p1 TRINITY_DN63010_c0_g1~~TRINITY_DN63010_c0_g1_i1.p1  ORF type:complete len:204 (-),score=29.51 TRINITY_DN63010_c0_g1_i1:232-843(-)